MDWVTKNRLAELTGLTKGAIDRRRERGIWLEGVHWKKAGDGRVWYNMKAIEQWVAAA